MVVIAGMCIVKSRRGKSLLVLQEASGENCENVEEALSVLLVLVLYIDAKCCTVLGGLCVDFSRDGHASGPLPYWDLLQV